MGTRLELPVPIQRTHGIAARQRKVTVILQHDGEKATSRKWFQNRLGLCKEASRCIQSPELSRTVGRLDEADSQACGPTPRAC